MGIAASLVTVNVAVLIIVSVNHRVKVFTIISVIQMLVIAIYPILISYEQDIPSVISMNVSSLTAIVLSLLIRNWSGTSVTTGEFYIDSNASDS